MYLMTFLNLNSLDVCCFLVHGKSSLKPKLWLRKVASPLCEFIRFLVIFILDHTFPKSYENYKEMHTAWGKMISIKLVLCNLTIVAINGCNNSTKWSDFCLIELKGSNETLYKPCSRCRRKEDARKSSLLLMPAVMIWLKDADDVPAAICGAVCRRVQNLPKPHLLGNLQRPGVGSELAVIFTHVQGGSAFLG